MIVLIMIITIVSAGIMILIIGQGLTSLLSAYNNYGIFRSKLRSIKSESGCGRGRYHVKMGDLGTYFHNYNNFGDPQEDLS